ncbi:MAG: leucine-rich repeat domain-containing protein [Clostridia bacterium]|nr:leucine-rich repeat domain-containing protein [Clostridia bacterium]
MNNRDLFEAIGYIDDSLIERSYRSMTEKRSGKTAIIRFFAIAAACAMIALSSFLIIKRGGEGEVKEVDGFRIKDGVLISYTGNDTEINIPDGVKSIAAYAFMDNSNAGNITVMRLDGDLQTIDINALAGLENLEYIDLDKTNGSFVRSDGLLMSADGSVLIRYERRGEEKFVLPDTVRSVSAHAVQGTSLTEIDFGDKLEAIGSYAFASNYHLKAIMLPDTVKYIGQYAFADCGSAVDGHVPDGAVVGEGAFRAVPFYISLLAGKMCPAEEIERGIVTPTGALFKSDITAFYDQVEIILAGLRGELDNVYPQTEIQRFAYNRVPSKKYIPADLEVPDSVKFEDLEFADNGWGGNGLYDLQVFLPCGDYEIVMEAAPEGFYEEVYWDDCIFRIEHVFFVRINGASDNSFTYTEHGWTASYEYKDGKYMNLIFRNENGRLVRDFAVHQSNTPFVFIFSPDGTRVAVEYTYGDDVVTFFIQSLNGDVLTYDEYDYNDYLSGYFGRCYPGTIHWTDNDNLEGENIFGRFTFCVFDINPVQDAPDEEVRANLAMAMDIISTTAGDIRKYYGDLCLYDSEFGAAQPVFGISGIEGLEIVFYDMNMYDRPPDDLLPSEVIMTSDYPYSDLGALNTRVEDSGLEWESGEYYPESGKAWLEKKYGNFCVSAFISLVGQEVPADPDSSEFKEWFDSYIKEPKGMITQLRIVDNRPMDERRKSVDNATADGRPAGNNDPAMKEETYELPPFGYTTEYSADDVGTSIGDTVKVKDGDYIKVGGILIRVNVTTGDGYISASEISAYGQTVNLRGENALQITGNIKFAVFETDKYAVVGKSYYENGEYYIFSKDSCVHVTPPEWNRDHDDDYEIQSGITFYAEDGILRYQRIPLKFQVNVHQVYGGLMELCVSRNELYRESGRAEIENGEIVYYPEKSETVSDAFDLEEEYSRWQEVWKDSEDNNISELTLDEYLAQNAKIHKRAY